MQRDPHHFPVSRLALGAISFLAISMAFNSLSGVRQSGWFAVLASAQLLTGISVLLLATDRKFFRRLYLYSLAFSAGLVIVDPRLWLLCGFPHGLFLLAYAGGRR